MRTINPTDQTRGRRAEAGPDAWEITVALPWCVIRIELPRQRVDDFNARRRSPAMAEPSPRAAARPFSRRQRPSAANGWRV